MRTFFLWPFLFATQLCASDLAIKPDSVRLRISDIDIITERFTVRDNKASAKGGIYFSSDDFYARCDEINCDISSKTIDASCGHVLLDGLGISATNVHYDEDKIIADDADVYFHFGARNWSPQVHGQRVTYNRRSRKITVRGGQFRLGAVPLMVLPRATVGVRSVKGIKLRFNAGHSRNKGYYFQHLAIAHAYEDLSLGYILNYYSHHGFLFGPIVKLKSSNEQVQGQLNIVAAGISDRRVPNSNSNKHRWFSDINGNYHLGDRVDVTTSYFLVSDHHVEKDFTNHDAEFYKIHDAFTEVNFRGDGSLLTAFVRPKINADQTFVQELPSLRWDYFPHEIGTSGIYYSGFVDVRRMKGIPQNKTKKTELTRIDGYAGLRYPINWNGNHITLQLGGRWTKYCGQTDRFLGEIGVDWSTEFSKIYNQRVLGTNYFSWRHCVRPIVQYRYFPKLNKCREYARFDGKYCDHLLPLGLASCKDVDLLSERSILRLGLEQDFFVKTKKGRVLEFASIDVYQDLNFVRKNNKGKEDVLGNFYLFSELRLSKWLKCELYTRHRWENLRFKEAGWRLGVQSGDCWDFGLFSKFRRNKYHQLGTDFSMQLNAVSRCGVIAKADVHQRKFLSTELFFATCFGEVWDCYFFCKFKNHTKRNDGKILPGFRITLKRW